MSESDDRLLRAFVEGAKWWAWTQEGATMWQSDQRAALDEAERRLANGTLGDSFDEMVAKMASEEGGAR